MESEHCYIAIDMKSFYASVECVARGYDPLTTNLLVADESRSDQTICLAVSPSLKAISFPKTGDPTQPDMEWTDGQSEPCDRLREILCPLPGREQFRFCQCRTV